MKNIHQLLLFSLSLLFFSSWGLAQPSPEKGSQNMSNTESSQNRIIGKIVDEESQKPLEYATVTLLSQSDSTLVTGAVSDLEGNFTIETRPGSYFLTIEFISYAAQYIPGLTVSRDIPVINIGTINMAPDAQSLAEVEVRAEKSQMQMRLDKKVFNVGKDLASTSSSAADLLDNIPSVTVDIDGNVSLRGNENVRVLVDGRPSGLVGVRGTSGLRSLPANLIDRVEVITNPSARYEAEGMTGIINIVLKKDRQKGLNGSFDVSAGYPDYYGAAVNLNFRRKKFNLFTNYGLNYRSGPGKDKLYQEYYRGDSTFYLNQTRERERGGWSNNIRLGADYFPNQYNTFTGSFQYRLSNDKNNSSLEYYDYLNSYPDNLTGITYRTEEEEEIEPNIEYDLNYKRTFEREGQEFKANIQYRQSTEEENSDYYQESFNPDLSPTEDPPLLQRSSNVENETSFLAQIDYVHPFSKDRVFEIGYRGSLRRIDNDYLVEEFDDENWMRLDNLSNDFNYDENIHAAYAIFGDKPGRFSYQLGLRLEHSQVLTELLQTNEVNDRIYTNLFPTVHITYEFPGQNNIQLSYSRRINRPRFWYLNPFFTFSDNRNIYRGNPNLDPEFTHSVEMGHIKYWENTSVSSSIYYRHTDGVIQRIRTLDGEGDDATTITQPENLATEDAYGLEFIVTSEIAKWWRMDGSLNFFHSMIDGSNLGEDFTTDNFSWFGRLNSRTTIKKTYDLQLRFNYRAPRQTTQGESRSMYSIDFGLSRDILKKKGTLTLNARDLLNTRKRRYETFGDNFYSNGTHQWRSRRITLTFNYRLNQKKRRGGQRNRGDYEGGGDMEFGS